MQDAGGTEITSQVKEPSQEVYHLYLWFHTEETGKLSQVYHPAWQAKKLPSWNYIVYDLSSPGTKNIFCHPGFDLIRAGHIVRGSKSDSCDLKEEDKNVSFSQDVRISSPLP
jgi:hypothetical protein